jgi:glycosyltransferase involved in cell wall biosynthesis
MRKPVALLLDVIYDNTGDKTARLVMEKFFQSRGILHEVLNPLNFDPTAYNTIVVGGGELIRNKDGGYYDSFRVAGPHILNAVGVMADRDFDYLNRYEYVAVRSNADKEQLQPVVGDVRVVPCVGMLVKPAPLHYSMEPRTIGFHFAPATVPPRQEIEPVLRKLGDWKKLFVPFTHYNNDRKSMEPLAEMTADARLAPYLEPEELFALIGQLDFLVASSLHACLFAYASNVPFLAIDLSPAKKIEAFMTDRGLEEWLFEDTVELAAKLERILEHPPDYSDLIKRDFQSLKDHLDRIESMVKTGAVLVPGPEVKQRPRRSSEELLAHIQRSNEVIRERDFGAARRTGQLEIKVAEMQAAMWEQERELDTRKAALAERDAAATQRDALLTEKDAAMADKDAALVEKDAALAKTEAALSQRNEVLEQTTQELITIRQSLGYRILEGYRRPIRWLFPQDSWRSLPYRAMRRTVRGLLDFRRRPASVIRRALKAQRRYGTKALVGRSISRLSAKTANALDPVRYALTVDWRTQRSPQLIVRQPLNIDSPTINWVIPTVGEGGGHLNIFRFVRFLAQRGFQQRIYEMPVGRTPRSSRDELAALIQRLYGLSIPDVCLDFEDMVPSDITVATSWHTAYPVFKFAETRKKLYLVQDYEPLFTATGTESALAENTYRFGFHGVTAGRWLAERLTRDFGMECDYFNLAVDLETYFPRNLAERKKVFFYARPATPRRGFDLGIKALEIFHSRNPDYQIVFAGGDLNGMSLPFPATNVGYTSEQKLNDLYNESAAALVVSLTNCSLLPLDIMATGCPVVTTTGENNEKVLPPDSAIFVAPSPHHLAEALEDAVRNPPPGERLSQKASQFNWEDEAVRLDAIFKRLLRAQT